MRIFEIAGDSSRSPFWPAGALRISAFSLLWTVSLVLGYTFPFSFLLFFVAAAQWNWDGSNNCYFLHRSVVPASGPEGRKEEGGIGERQTCTGRISVTCSEQINSATTEDGERREEKKRKMGKINKTDGRLFEPNNQGALRQPDSSSALRTPLTFSTTSHRVRRTSRATSMPAAC